MSFLGLQLSFRLVRTGFAATVNVEEHGGVTILSRRLSAVLHAISHAFIKDASPLHSRPKRSKIMHAAGQHTIWGFKTH